MSKHNPMSYVKHAVKNLNIKIIFDVDLKIGYTDIGDIMDSLENNEEIEKEQDKSGYNLYIETNEDDVEDDDFTEDTENEKSDNLIVGSGNTLSIDDYNQNLKIQGEKKN